MKCLWELSSIKEKWILTLYLKHFLILSLVLKFHFLIKLQMCVIIFTEMFKVGSYTHTSLIERARSVKKIGPYVVCLYSTMNMNMITKFHKISEQLYGTYKIYRRAWSTINFGWKENNYIYITPTIDCGT